ARRNGQQGVRLCPEHFGDPIRQVLAHRRVAGEALHRNHLQLSTGLSARDCQGSSTFRPSFAERYAAWMTSSTALPYSPSETGFPPVRTQSTKWVSSWG